jgi:cytidyltransferase-like protein
MESFPVNNGQRDINSAASPDGLRISIVSGYFNPIHVGHIRMMEAAAEMADHLIVIVNNDEQQVMKKGRIITGLDDRLEIVRALRIVDEAVAAIDDDATVKQTLASIRERYPSAALTFANGGDRSSTSVIAEAELCEKLGIDIQLGVGGTEKADSSSRINAALGIQ